MNLHYFNPGHELAVLNGSPYYHLPEVVKVMQRDLGYLPAWYANSEDLIYTGNEMKNSRFLSYRNNFPTLPQAVTTSQIKDHAPGELSCWGISPQAIHLFDTINQQYNTEIALPVWRKEFLYLTSRNSAQECLEKIISNCNSISSEIIPHPVSSIEEIEEKVSLSPTPLLVKSPFSSSGRGLLWLKKGIGIKEKELLKGMFRKQKTLRIELVVDKKLDFSMQFLSDGTGSVSYEGVSIFETTERGAYTGSYLNTQSYFFRKITSFVAEKIFFQVKNELISFLQERYAPFYKGVIGVDMMIYEDQGEYKIHPCVEINMRYNMGYLALKLQENYISPHTSGTLFLKYHGQEGKAWGLHQEAEEKYPLKIRDGKIINGYLPLCEVSESSKYHCYIFASS